MCVCVCGVCVCVCVSSREVPFILVRFKEMQPQYR